MSSALGVGIVGAGPVVQSIHLPTLALLADEFVVRHIVDVDLELAERVAARVNARASISINELLDDTSVDVVAICSPSFLHAEHVEMVCRSGKKAILCEKPLATTTADLDRIAAAVRQSGVPVVIGAMHVYDPGWVWAKERLDELPLAQVVRSRIVLPRNVRYEDWATEIVNRPPRPGSGSDTLEERIRFLTNMILGLAVHDLPLVRRFAPRIDRVESALVKGSLGYAIHATGPDVDVVLSGFMNENWKPDWTLEAVGDDYAVSLSFPPSFVHAGPARATVANVSHSWSSPRSTLDGYIQEWREVGVVARSERSDPADVETALDDAAYALRLVDLTTAALRGQA